ncbi:MAG TPA: UDP-N-acetylglucosamine 1-carboxyvinyltransferase [Patescibacteria group bacterium]
MAKLIIEGGKTLNGKITVAGNKNSVLPIMAATLLTDDECVIENVPQILDVEVMSELLTKCGAEINGVGSRTLTICAKNIKKASLDSELTQKLRASSLVLGPMLSRVGQVEIGYPGGDIIGRRPLDTHIQALGELGAKVEKRDHSFFAKASGLAGTDIFLEEASVTATENTLMAAVLAKGTTKIRRAASEPHVVDLCEFLIKMGAKISGVGSNVLTIEGVDKLTGTTHSVRIDHIEVGTFAILGAICGGTLEISPIIKDDLDSILQILDKFNVDYQINKDTMVVKRSKLTAVEKVVTDIWPGFPSDLMAPTIVLATQAEGVTLLHDWMYESRMFFVDKLLSMGAKVEIADPHRVLVYGPSKLISQRLDTPDIRAGMALLIAALTASGTSEIDKAELIERGYENIVERLSQLGAKIVKQE